MMAEKTLPWADWEIVRRLGGGSYGTVYEIRRERYGIVERAAMKVISFPKDAEEVEDQRRSGFTDESLVNSYRQQMQRFLDEYRLMLELKGKTNIVSCDDFQTVPHADGIGWDIFIKMELLTPLKKYLAREITPEQTVKLGIDLCKALSLCREKDIIHRDIKPDNILVSDSGDFKLGDFGVAKTAERTMAGTRTGTPNFTAPEVYHNEPYGKSVDIYSLGMVLYWMLNRRALPFLPLPPHMPSPDEMQDALLRRMRGEALPRPADGSRALQDVVLKTCAYRPEDRYATPEELRRALKAVRAADTSAADTIPDVQPAAPAAEPSSTDADATMGNNWETGPQTETQPELTDFDATDATMGTCGTLPASHAEPQPSGAAAPVAGKTDEFYDYGAEYRADTSDPDSAKIAYDEENKLATVSGIMSYSALQRARQCMRAHGSNGLFIRTAGVLSREIMIQIGSFTDLDYLEIRGNGDEKQVSDITPLSNLTNLTGLCLRDCRVSDYSFLSNLTNLTSLYFGDYEVLLPDLTPLSGLKNLKCLYFMCCFGFSDFMPLSSLTNLTNLTLVYCPAPGVIDLTPLSSLTNLTNLNFSGCYNLSDISPLSNLTNLTSLDLHDCEEVSDLSPLSSLTNLTRLDLHDCKKVSDLSPLSSLEQLEFLDIRGTDVKSLNGLENARNLQRLNASQQFRFNTIRALKISGRKAALQITP